MCEEYDAVERVAREDTRHENSHRHILAEWVRYGEKTRA
jgi:hypothetical protein